MILCKNSNDKNVVNKTVYLITPTLSVVYLMIKIHLGMALLRQEVTLLTENLESIVICKGVDV